MNEFGRLLENEIPRMRRYARALTRNTAKADDLVQSSLVRALEKQHLWQPGSNLRAWLFTILHNQHVNDVRHSLRQGLVGPVEDAEPGWSVEPVADASLQLRDLQQAINALSHEQREVLLLVGLEGMRYEQVATILDIPVGTVRSRLSRARTTLRLLMDGAETANNRWRERCEGLAAQCGLHPAATSMRTPSAASSAQRINIRVAMPLSPLEIFALAASPLLAQGESVSPAVGPLRCASTALKTGTAQPP